jgi:hypothetical protein
MIIFPSSVGILREERWLEEENEEVVLWNAEMQRD